MRLSAAGAYSPRAMRVLYYEPSLTLRQTIADCQRVALHTPMSHIAPSALLCDPLTGALTRHSFDALLSQSMEQAATQHASLTLLVIDIDHFKSINDSFGHIRGDMVLIEVIQRLRETLRAGDLLFRFGGDEFVVLLPAPSRAHALQVAERLLVAAQRTPFSGTPPLSLTLSIGAATFPEDADTPEALLIAADRRVYHAKRTGRGRVSSVDAPTRLAPASAPPRLIERDEALTVARDLLSTNDAALRSLCLRAAPGTGRTRYLAELSRAAASLGYATLSISGGPALRARRYGALVTSATDWPTPPPSEGTEPFVSALVQAARSRGTSRLLITIDDPSGIDTPSLDFLRELAGSPALSHVLLAYVDGPVWASRLARDSLPQLTASLAPLTPQGIMVWLRQVLRWEPPASLVSWVASYSDGFPSRIRRAVDELIRTGALATDSEGWIWDLSLALGIAPYAANAAPLLSLLDSAPLLVGRDTEIGELRDLLLSRRLVTIVGQGGVGKTRLALQAAAECYSDFRDGAHFVALAGVEHTAHITGAMMSALQLPPVMSAEPHTRLVAHLSGREMLLVLDNFEHLADGASMLTELLRAAPDLRILVTSRERLGLPEEGVLLLDGLALPTDGHSATAAVQLFHQRARQVDPVFAPTEEDTRSIGRICALLNGLPLGIELAASFCQTYSSSAILAELERSLGFLTDTRDGRLERHRSLTAVLDSFWEILSHHERRALQALAVFRGGFTREAARAIAGASSFFLDGLTAKTVLRRSSGGRFTIHELLRQYAAEKLHARPLAEARAHDRHSAYFLQRLIENYARPASSADLQLDLDNIRAAWEWTVANRRLEGVATSLHALCMLLVDLGLVREGLATNESTHARLERACVAEGRQNLLAHLEVKRGLFVYYMARYAEAIAAAQRAEEMLDGLDEPLIRARAHYLIGACHLILGEHGQAQTRLEQALVGADGDERLAVEILYIMTHLANLAGDSARADAYGASALQRAQAAGDRRSEHQVLLFLGIGHMFQERYDQARSYLESIIAQTSSARQAVGDILALANLAQVSWELQEYRRAATEVERSIGLARAVDMPYLEGIGLRVRGLVALSTGRVAQAEAAFAEALAIFRASNAERDVARILAEQALLASWRGAHDVARAAAEEALAIARTQRFAPIVAHALLHYGHALLGLGEYAAAAAAYRDGREQFEALGRRNRAAEALAGMVEVALAHGRREDSLTYGRMLGTHLEAGRAALGGMYDPARVCMAAAEALRDDDPGRARAAEALAACALAWAATDLAPDRTQEHLARIPSRGPTQPGSAAPASPDT
jgi:diguanylate cyclase (GGDEF)-like protein